MNESVARLQQLDDPALPAMRALLGAESVDVLGTAVEGVGEHMISRRLTQVSWSPGLRLTVVFDARVSSVKGTHIHEHLVAATATTQLRGGVQLEDESGAHIAVWRLQNDPELPGLAVAMDEQAIRGLLDGLGLPRGEVTARLRAYRPMRRAVVEVSAGGQRLFIKVVPPSHVRRLQSLHETAAQHLPVPPTHGWSLEHGLVVLRAMPGVTLRNCLLDKRLDLPDPVQVYALLQQLPALPDSRPAREQAAAALEMAPLLRALVPECRSSIDGIVQQDFPSDASLGGLVPVHGDLHEAQMMVQAGSIAGLLDIDTAGLGHRIDDWATLLGHLAVLLNETRPSSQRRVRTYAQRLMALADRDVGDPSGLRTRIAAVILGLATGPFRVQTPSWVEGTRSRISLAEAWQQSARSHAANGESILSHA